MEKIVHIGQGFRKLLFDLTRSKAHRKAYADECKFVVMHNGKRGRNGFYTQWITRNGNITKNNEVLNGMGPQEDIDILKLKGTGQLDEIVFFAFGSPCVKSIIIDCGVKLVPINDPIQRIQIDYSHMNAAYIRDNGRNQFKNITTEWDNDCVHFRGGSHDSGYVSMYVNAAIFKCQRSDGQCIQSHLLLY